MIAQYQKIPHWLQYKLSTRLKNILFFLLNFTYIYSYLFFRFDSKSFKHLYTSIKSKKINFYTQNGFGDVFFSILLISYLRSKYSNWDFNLSIHYSDLSSDKNIISPKINKKKLLYGDYISVLESKIQFDYFSGYRGDCYKKGMLYTHIPFYRFLGYQNIISQSSIVLNEFFVDTKLKSKYTNKKYIIFYFRNSIEQLNNIFETYNEVLINKGFDIYLLGENVPKYLTKPNLHFIDESVNFFEKIGLLSNSCLSFTGRGGFALIPLFNNKPTFSFFDQQGLSEFESGLWDLSLWKKNIINRPFFDSDINYLTIIDEKIIEQII
jgi:hypothetical protein